MCGCYAGGWKCDQNCLEKSLVEDSLFYPIGTVRWHLLNTIWFLCYFSRIYIIMYHICIPTLTSGSLVRKSSLDLLQFISDIVSLGHSLGGALASLLGVTFGAPVVAFEAPGERMAAGRLHLPSPVSTSIATSFR